MRSMNLEQKKRGRLSLGLVLVARHKNWPNLVLAKHQIAITFALTIIIGHIVCGFWDRK